MSFSLSRPGAFGAGVAAAGGGGQVQMGADLEEIVTEVTISGNIAFTSALLLNS